MTTIVLELWLRGVEAIFAHPMVLVGDQIDQRLVEDYMLSIRLLR